MRLRISLTLAIAAVLVTGWTASAQSDYHKGKALFEKGMFDRARTFFEKAGDPLSEAYAVLCAVKTGSEDYEGLLNDYFAENSTSVLAPELHCQYGLNLFDKGQFDKAAAEMDKVDEAFLSEAMLPEFTFKRGYCHFVADEIDAARRCFSKVEGMPFSTYTGSSEYFLGYLDYMQKDFDGAEDWFAKSAGDPRFAGISEFYLLECRFMKKDYRYVVEEGEKMMETAPEERQSRLSRLISESYLVLGDKSKALEYYWKEKASAGNRTRSDYFHAGSVLYGVADYDGAIENFSAMTERTDSLGQVANYQLGYSYIRKGNKVAALEAFNDAAKYAYNPSIQEDAAFNYAKLAFDLNHDPNGFKAYLAKYSTKVKGEQVYSYMAVANLFNRDYAAAIEAYENIENLDEVQKGNYVKANYLRAGQLMESKSWSDAIPYLRAAGFYYPKSDPFNQLTRYWLGQAYYNTEKYDEAVKTFTELYNTSALANKPEGRMVPYDLAYCHFKTDNLSNASRWFDNYLSSGDKTVRKDALTRRADCDFLRRSYSAAANGYQKVMDEYSDVNDIYPYFRQALSYGLSGDRKKKVEVLSRVKDADPAAPMYSEAMYELGRSYLDISDNRKATETFNAIREKSSDSTYVARALIGLGMVNRNTSNYDKALEYYKAVIEMMPGSEYAQDALLAIESIYQTKKQPELYLAYLEAQKLNVNKTPEERAAMYFNTAEQVFLSGNYQNAVKLLESYLSNYPEGAGRGEATFYLAESYKVLGNMEKACAEYAKVPALLSEGSYVETSRLNCANINYGLERYADAYVAYLALLDNSRMDASKAAAKTGMLRSAYRARDYESAVKAADAVEGVESDYIRAKSLLALSRREEAMKVFAGLAADPSTAEGAEAAFILIQDAYDRADYDKVENLVYDFSQKGVSQSYWLSRAYLVLGDSFAARGNKAQAKATYESIRDGYVPAGPDDDVQDNVKLRLERLESAN